MQLPTPPAPQLDIVTLSTVNWQPLDWLWRGKFPLAKLSVLAGDPSLGKSFLALDLAAKVSAGKAWPDGSGVSPVGDVLLLSAEDAAATAP